MTAIAGHATLASRLADFVVDCSADDLGPDVLRWASMRVLDFAVSALAGLDASSTTAVMRALVGEPQGDATVVGVGQIATPRNAALVNGAMAHAAEFDDDHRLATLHPGAVVVPAALAATESAGACGKTFLRAVVLGYETTCRVGEAFVGRQFYRGFHPTGTCGVFGASVAAGTALNLGQPQMTHALAIAGTQACGLGEWRSDGSWTKRLHPGLAAQNGLLAAIVAREGFTGPASILEGSQGFMQAYADNGFIDLDVVTRGLGQEFRALSTAWKPYPCCRFAHGAIELALEARSSGITADNVERVIVQLFRTDILTDNNAPRNDVEAQFSVPYLVAAAIIRGSIGLSDFGPEAIREPAVLELAQRVAVEIDEEFSTRYPEQYPTRLVIERRQRDDWSAASDIPAGDPEAPLYRRAPDRFDKDLLLKVERVTADLDVAEAADALVTAVDGLVQARGVSALSRAMKALGGAGRGVGRDVLASQRKEPK